MERLLLLAQTVQNFSLKPSSVESFSVEGCCWEDWLLGAESDWGGGVSVVPSMPPMVSEGGSGGGGGGGGRRRGSDMVADSEGKRGEVKGQCRKPLFE